MESKCRYIRSLLHQAESTLLQIIWWNFLHELLLLNDKKIYLLFRFALGLLKSLNFKPMSFFTFIGLAPGSKILLLMFFSDLSYSDDRLTNLSYDWDMS